jgi:hypothetical protein
MTDDIIGYYTFESLIYKKYIVEYLEELKTKYETHDGSSYNLVLIDEIIDAINSGNSGEWNYKIPIIKGKLKNVDRTTLE